MKKETLLVAFSTQKGGAGKTTLTVLMASYLYYVKGMDVAVIDCDYPQYSIKDMRERDMRNIERNAHLRKTAFEQFARLKKKMYPIVESRPEKAVEKAKDFLAMETPPDIIFFDLPGTVNNSDVINTVATMDYVFCPIMADRVVAESSLNFATVVNDTLLSTAGTESYAAKAVDIDDAGRLIVAREGGRTEALCHGEVSIRPSPLAVK